METWMNQTWWLYDLTVLAVLILCIWSGWRHGVLHAAAKLLGCGLAAVLAGFLAQPAAEFVFDHWAAEPCTAILTEKLEQYPLGETLQQTLSAYGISLDDTILGQLADDPDHAADQLYGAISQRTGLPEELLEQGMVQLLSGAVSQLDTGLPDWMADALIPADSSQLQNRGVQIAALLLTSSTEEAAKELTQTYVRPAFVSVVKTFAFSVLFLLIFTLLQGIIKGMSQMRRTVGGHLADQTLGAAAGLVQAVILLVCISVWTKWITEQGAGQLAFFNETSIEKTILFQRIYHIIA